MAMRCNGNGQNLVALTGLAPNSKDVNEDGAFVAAARATQQRHRHTPSPTGTRRDARTLVVNQPTCVVVLGAMPWSKNQGSSRYARRTLADSPSTRQSSSHISAVASALEILRLCPGRVCQPQTKPGVGISLTLIDAQSTGQKNPTPRLLVHVHLDTPFVTAGPLQAAEKKAQQLHR